MQDRSDRNDKKMKGPEWISWKICARSCRWWIRVIQPCGGTDGFTEIHGTRQVQALESELGVKLLHRTSRRLSMTEQGEAYYHGAIRLLNQMEILDSNVQAATQAPRGKIRVEMPNAIAYRRVIPALPGFLMHYPDVQVEVSVGNRTADLIAQNIDRVIRIGELQTMR